MTQSWHILPWLQNIIFKLKFKGQSECFMVHIFMQNHVVASNENLAGLYHLLLQGICWSEFVSPYFQWKLANSLYFPGLIAA